MSHPEACHCGSGEFPSRQFDGHGIFLCYTCDKCHAKKMREFRTDIMERYSCDEPIDSD